MLHGGGPGASGRVQLLAQHRRARRAFPGDRARHARLWPLGQGCRPVRSIRLPRRHDPRPARRTRHRHSVFGRQLLRRRGRAAVGAGHAPACRQACPHGSRRDRDYPRCPHRRTQEPIGVLRRRRTQPRQAGDLHPELPCLRGASVPDDLDRDCVTRPRSIPRWWPTRRCAVRPDRRRCARCGGWTSPATRASSIFRHPTLVLWGRHDKVNRPSGGPMLAQLDAQRRSCHDLATPAIGCSGSEPTCSTRWPSTSSAQSSVFAPMNIFGSVHLGYVVIETEKFAEWRRFGLDAIGMHLDETVPDVMRFRLDDNECRFCCGAGPPKTSPPSAGTSTTIATFDEILARVTRHGVPVIEGTTAEEAGLRGVERLVRFPGPNGLTQEIFTRPSHRQTRRWIWRYAAASSPAQAGIGHVAVTSTKPHQMRGYYDTVFDARLTDLHRRNHQRTQVQDPIPAGQPTPPLRCDRRGQPVAYQPYPHPCPARQHPGRRPRRHDRVLSAGERTWIPHGAGGRTAHQRPGTVLLRHDAVGLRMGSRLESHRRRREDLGANDVSGHQHLGPHPRGTDRSSRSWRSSRPRPSRCCTAKTPSPRWLVPASPTTTQEAIDAAYRHPPPLDPP